MENLIFDYRSLGEKLAVPQKIVQKIEEEARKEFPFDNMLMEIHILRAVKAYAKISNMVTHIENWYIFGHHCYKALFDERTPERLNQTQQFWKDINEYNVFISELVIDEIKGASQPLQDKMLEKITNFTSLSITDEVQSLAEA